ncbi:MAG TPA: hypothetical protein VMM12_09780 [Longimicrobiales bacterium]|nr:hypothetical protein [Longimicrobiales bacterium]
MSTTTAGYARKDGRTVTRGIGVAGRVAVSWGAAGGILVGGFLVAAMTLAGQLSGHGLLVTSTGLFITGAVLGFAHGGVLGWLGRPPKVSRRDALAGLALAGAYAIPALLLSWLVSGWIAMTTVALYAGKTLALTGVAVAWLVGLVLVGTAAGHGWSALRGAYGKWEHARVGTLLVGALFGGLLAVFLAERPELWGLRMRVTPVGAVLLATAATLWLAGPVVTVGLALRERLPSPHPAVGFGSRREAFLGIAVAMLVGIGLALVALPFYQAAYGLGTGTAVSALSTALVDEVLLRLFFVTGLAWLLLREFDLSSGRAAALAVLAAAGVQVLVYLPGVLAIGFPSPLTAAAFLTLTVAVPAVAFGVLYWRRGFGAALVAHATALTALFLIVGR